VKCHPCGFGRTAPKIKAGSKWRDLDAQVVYDCN
jgi:hypothetical protein